MQHPPLTRLLLAIADLVWARPRAVLLANLLVSLVLGYYAVTVRVDSSFLGVLDDTTPEAHRLAEVSRDFKAASSVVLVITGGDEAARREAAMAAQERLKGVPEISDATAQITPELLASVGPIWLDDASFSRVVQAVEPLPALLPQAGAPPSLDGLLRTLADQLAAPGDPADAPPEAAQALAGVRGLVNLVAALPQTEASAWDQLLRQLPDDALIGPGGIPMRQGFIASADGAVYAVDIRTTLDPVGDNVGLDAFEGLERAIDPVRAAHPELVMRYAGLVPGAHQDQSNVLGKVIPLSSVTLLVVLAALYALDRSLVTVIAAGFCLVMSTVWAYGVIHIVFGYASLMATSVGTMLFGLGIDYAAHLTVRYNEEHARGVDGREALRNMLGHTGRGVTIGGMTMVMAFALMTLTDFKAATHLGIAASVGLASALILQLTAYPAILRLFDRRTDRAAIALNVAWLDRLVRWCLAHPRAVYGITGAVILASIAMLPRFTLETDLKKIITQDLPALAAAEDLARAFGGSAEAILSVNNSVEQSRERAIALAALPQVARVDGVHRLIPPGADARAARNQALLPALERLGALTPTARDSLPSDAIVAELRRLQRLGARVAIGAGFAGRPEIAREGKELRFAAERAIERVSGQDAALARTEAALFGNLQRVQRALVAVCALDHFGPEQLPAQVRDRYESQGQFVSFVYPRDHRIEFHALQDFKAAVHAIDPGATGNLFVTDQILVGGIRRLPVALAAILICLIGIITWDLRSFRHTLLALIPLTVACFVAVGVVLAMRIPVTVLMLAAYPLLFGIGIDNGVHILHRAEEAGDDIPRAVAQVGKAILFTSGSNVFGFSILFLLNHRGMEGLAMVVSIGVTTCCVTSLTLLPVLLRRFPGKPRFEAAPH